MKKRVHLLVVMILLLLITPQLFAQYNRSAVVSAMRNSSRLIGEISAAANASDFYTTAVKLMELAQEFKALDRVPPPRGSRAEWDRIHGELIEAAFRGIGACGERDGEALQAEIATIIALNQEGHSKFM
jgi:hypothetical protein